MTTQEDMDSVYALLAVLADPKAAKARLDELASTHQKHLDELSAAHEKALADTASLVETKSSADDQRQTAEATLMAHRLEVARFQKDMERSKAESAAQKQRFDEWQKALDDKSFALDADRRKASDLQKDLDTREERIKATEELIAKHAADAAKAHSDAAALKKVYEDRVAALRNAMAD